MEKAFRGEGPGGVSPPSDGVTARPWACAQRPPLAPGALPLWPLPPTLQSLRPFLSFPSKESRVG